MHTRVSMCAPSHRARAHASRGAQMLNFDISCTDNNEYKEGRALAYATRTSAHGQGLEIQIVTDAWILKPG